MPETLVEQRGLLEFREKIGDERTSRSRIEGETAAPMKTSSNDLAGFTDNAGGKGLPGEKRSPR